MWRWCNLVDTVQRCTIFVPNANDLKKRFHSVVDTATTLQAGRSGVRIPVGERDFVLLQNVQTGCGAHTASYSVGTEVLSMR